MKIKTFIKLGDICDISAGQGAPQGDSNYCDNGTPFVKAGNLIELLQGKNETDIQKVSEDVAKKHKLKKYTAGSILFAKSGMSCMKGYVYQLKNDSYVVSHLAIVKPIKDSSDYIEYCLRHIKPNSLVKDEAYPSISLQDISNLKIPLPSLEEQIKISKQLYICTQIINKHKKQLERYDTLIKSRFIEMFGDPYNNTKYPYKNVGEFTTVTSGGTPDRKNNEYWKNGKIPWVKTTELQNNELTEVEEFITQKGLDESSAKMMPKGTLLIAMYGQGKTRGMTAYLGIEASTNQACACILPSKEINQRYLWYYFILSYDKLRDLAKGGNQPNLNGNMIKSFPVLMPPIDMQNKYVSFVQQIDKSKFAVQKSLEKAEILYKSLMQQYFA